MNPKRFFYIMLAVFTLSLVGGVAMLVFANKVLKQRSSNVVALKLESIEVEQQLSAYQAAKKDVEKYAYLNDIINSALPQDKDQARAVREIFKMASDAGISIKSIQFPTSTLGGTGKTAGTANTTAQSAATAITQAKPLEGIKGVYYIETTVTPNADAAGRKVTYNQLIKFLENIESNRRAMQVASLQLDPFGQGASDSISFTLTLNIFTRP